MSMEDKQRPPKLVESTQSNNSQSRFKHATLHQKETNAPSRTQNKVKQKQALECEMNDTHKSKPQMIQKLAQPERTQNDNQQSTKQMQTNALTRAQKCITPNT